MQFTPVPAQEQADIVSPQRAAWFSALLEHTMLEVASRPTLSEAQKVTLDEREQRMRSRVLDGKTYIWVEDVSHLTEATTPDEEDDEVPL